MRIGWLLIAVAYVVAVSPAVAVAEEAEESEEVQEKREKPLRFHSLLQSACACAPIPTTGEFPTCGCAPVRPSPTCQCTPVTSAANQCMCVSITISLSQPEPAPTTTTTTTTSTAAPTTTTLPNLSNQCSCLPIAGPVCGCSSTLTGRDCNCAPVQHAPGGPCSCIASGSSTSSLVAELIVQLTQQLQLQPAGGGLPPRTPCSPQQVNTITPSITISNPAPSPVPSAIRGDTMANLLPVHDTPLPTPATFPPQQLVQPARPVLQWVETRNYMTPGGAPQPAPGAPRGSISVQSTSTRGSESTLTSGSLNVPPPPPTPCLRPVCLTECRQECPLPVARICIEACQKSCEARCPALSMTFSAPTNTITTTTRAPSTVPPTTMTKPLSSIYYSNTITTNTQTSSTIPLPSLPTSSSSSTTPNIGQPLQPSTTHSQEPQIVVTMSLDGGCVKRCGDRCSNACAARNLDACDTICKITCEVSCSLPQPARNSTTINNSQSGSPQPAPLQQVHGQSVQLQQQEQQGTQATGQSGGFTQGVQQPPQRPVAPLLYFPYTIAAPAVPASVVSVPSSSACPLGCAQPSGQSPQPTVQHLQQAEGNNLQQLQPQNMSIIRLTVDMSATPSTPPPPSVEAQQCVLECRPLCAPDCVGASPVPQQPTSTTPLPPSPPTAAPQQLQRTVVDLGASLVQLCAAVPSCTPECTPACLEKAATACAPDCVSACRLQCAAQSQPVSQCAPACSAVCAASC